MKSITAPTTPYTLALFSFILVLLTRSLFLLFSAPSVQAGNEYGLPSFGLGTVLEQAFFFIENGVHFACLLKNDKKVLLLFLDILHLIRMNDEHVDVEKALERGMAGDEPTVLDYCTIRMY